MHNKPVNSLNLILFGITSNLAQKYLLQALYDLAEKELLPDGLKILGIARTPMTKKEIRNFLIAVLQAENKHHQHEIKQTVVDNLAKKLFYIDGHIEDPNLYVKIKQFIGNENPAGDIIYYLATYPELYETIFENLKSEQLNKQKNGWVRLMIEKPIGNNLDSARKINKSLLKYFQESQIYRLDHYLGKETLQNILTFRFGNNIFENLVNKDFVDHIQISLLEDFGVGKRGGYYDLVGALKDVGQNHLLQMLALATMDKPQEFSNKEITHNRAKVLKDLVPSPNQIIYGQYAGYRSEKNIPPDSRTDTFFAFKTELRNKRFKGVPIYIRSGKKLKQTVTEVSIVFKKPANSLFSPIGTSIPNVLIYRVQPNEGIVLKINTKKPGQTQKLEETYMQFCYRDYETALPDPYEKLILDVMKGDQTFFNDAKEIEASWKFIDPLVGVSKDLYIYEPGSYGPKEADDLIKADGREWLEPSNLFCKI
ncbi:glucose-6-phosphate dehydrogenase [Candidatus Daviesbacteria bacterium RIFCSPHIGHO2_01_FULL_44_29]|uniref:Glucose-6-phosphate 1-dehydrogenase n=1 Tax=Candidatus Daviesbacteria bacterium RIFCSPHIGHO2_02_FULL_43_12 TaxID=1797776 RepID=A0A1F5KK24_9BACT|nr:MAG: glucose-6-phosphate dehydrogenase [Candidatus Daviesbacteria bacterium RIFCSPHIGHO2_01_FULL_44_29]OGE39573.1 MAG: glucose-6-phosphate dehydrogenase [Candidatus Daviesbacteria bacterium RIFCSPHIGHO2_12_FULL_47_45]OGE41150.1 MAG: glucose-6-phosphate dehydrogenase [Candidatus Daviesbacteria bacterium RIFCSPHIGHO2_02_FULL_43_12]OGE69349.1 MAG: glucose-6-phosphate dehydrogenase [Candidatus Daviesbacteria bacterium RIFCSPLOWO2_01_FULL_43_15]